MATVTDFEIVPDTEQDGANGRVHQVNVTVEYNDGVEDLNHEAQLFLTPGKEKEEAEEYAKQFEELEVSGRKARDAEETEE